MKMTVIGCGYLGATHAACMAELGHEVLGMDSDIDKAHTLNSGRAPFFKRDLDGPLAKHPATGQLHPEPARQRRLGPHPPLRHRPP
ncbi:hypothetical protein GCM10010302_17330 [Streptomyces polychromogenes]|uniref:UDP-glucose/GDP-mannose dehydrogenase N-terminal domain-containing protein n=1 Tax=Streptomyces polychromogenes TaxID=67342 RepID=A0ABP3EX94_9ACTN